jgi:hypothetical protein
MLDEETKKFIEDYMAFSCKYCYDVKEFTTCEKVYTKCLEKAIYIADKFCKKGWKREELD